MMSHEDIPLLNSDEIESKLREHPGLQHFWEGPHQVVIFRNSPTLANPVYEVQLAWEWGDRLESFAWVWIDALEGRIIEMFSD